MLQSDLASSLSIDPRSLFHLILRLEKKVSKSPDKTRAGTFTNNLKLAKYKANPPSAKFQICRILEKAKNQVAVKEHLKNCISSTPKKFNAAIMVLCTEGYVNRLQIHGRQCIQLVKPLEKTKKEKCPDPVIGEGAALADLPIEHQVYRLISLSGEVGVCLNMLSLGNLERSLLAFLTFVESQGFLEQHGWKVARQDPGQTSYP